MFKTKSGQRIPAVTEDQMREVDRIAMEDFGLGVLQMMENAGRNLALNAVDMLGTHAGEVAVMAGSVAMEVVGSVALVTSIIGDSKFTFYWIENRMRSVDLPWHNFVFLIRLVLKSKNPMMRSDSLKMLRL